MSRQLFPYAADQHTIYRYLAGLVGQWPPEATAIEHYDGVLGISDGRLRMSDGSAIMWYDTAGALICNIPANALEPQVVRVFNHALKTLGTDEMVTREDPLSHAQTTNDPQSFPRWLFAGNYVRVGDPFMIAGSLGVTAFRVAYKERIASLR